MDENFLEMFDMTMQEKRRRLIAAFWINIIMIAVVWGLTFVPGIIRLGSLITGLSPKITYVAIIGALGLWGVFALAFFLAPGIATGRGVCSADVMNNE